MNIISGVVSVALGRATDENHFLGLTLENQPTNQEVQSICQCLMDHFLAGGVFLTRDFVGKEIHIRPSPRSEVYFTTLDAAIGEYRTILQCLGLSQWANEIALDGSLRPFDERDGSMPSVFQNKLNFFDQVQALAAKNTKN